MGQSDYAENFIKVMLGWIRQLASSIAQLFQTSSGSFSSSGGMAMVNWFSRNWLTLLIVLIVLGVVIDWVVWMLRWRPYWAWFHKRRILLDDDIDDQLSDEELAWRYGQEKQDGAHPPRFHSAALRGEDGENDEDEEDELYNDRLLDGADLDEAFFDEEARGAMDYVDVPDEDFQDTYREERTDGENDGFFEHLSSAGEEARDDSRGAPAPDEEELEDEDEPEPDLSDSERQREESARKGGLTKFLPRRKEKEADDDPFVVDEADFGDLNDGFYEAVAEEMENPLKNLESDMTPGKARLAPLSDTTGEFDWRVGYHSNFEPVAGTAMSRKERRRLQEEREKAENEEQ